MMARCKLNPCCGETMPGKCKPPPQFRAGESYEEYQARTTNDAPAPAPSGSGVRVKPLEWKPCAITKMNGLVVAHGLLIVASAQSALGLYGVCKGSQGRYEVWRGHTQATGSYDALDEAKAAAQADYEARILSALASDASPRGEAVGWMHPTAKWFAPDRDTIAMHCRQDERPVRVYAHPAPATVEMREPSMDQMMEAFEAGRKRAAPSDHLSGNPTLWPDVRGIDAVRELWRTALAPATEGRKG